MGNTDVGAAPARQHTVRRNVTGGEAWDCLPKTPPANKHLFWTPVAARFRHQNVTSNLQSRFGRSNTVGATFPTSESHACRRPQVSIHDRCSSCSIRGGQARAPAAGVGLEIVLR